MLGEVGVASISLLVVFIVLSAFFSGSEAALLSVQRVRIQHLVSTKTAGAARVARMVERPDKLLPPILLGNNLVNTAVAALATAIAIEVVSDENRGIIIATMVVTVVLLIFGETIPKTVAARHAERMSILIALPIEWISWVLRPVSYLLERISAAVALLFGGARSSREIITEEEIKTMVMVGREEGAVEHREAEMIHRVLEFGDRQVHEVMTPRPEIAWVEQGTTIQHFLELYNENYHTRFPVYQDKLDNVVGLVAVKDIMRQLAAGANMESSATTSVRPAAFVPETKRVQELFDEMRSSGEQLAMIADEFGGVAGLVTLKRLVEEIVGKVGDEDEPAPSEVVELAENVFDLDAGLSIGETNERLGLGLPAGEYDTLAGFLLERFGSIPNVGDEIFHESVRLSIAEMDGVRIARVRATVTPPGEEPE
ncbi:MAG: hemolysin family protein [Dehalococcoidia bacterium]